MKINLSNKFYSRTAIENAAKAFSEICECKILDGSFEVELIPNGADDNELRGEFCNFVLGLTKDNNLF